MTLDKLKETIDDLYERYEEEASNIKVRLAMQPNYPMKGSIENFCMELDSESYEPYTLYIACSDHQDYGPRDAWNEDEIYRKSKSSS